MSDLQQQLQAALGAGYRIEKELGGGGMSRVFLAEEVRLGRRVVVKVLPPEMAAGVSVDRFEREIQLAAKLQHPHVVPLLTAGSSGDLLYYIMPFIEGESLRAKLAHEGELPVPEVLRILRDVLDALAYAHRHHVVHRDIKPDNILLSEGHALVTDFGVAKAVAESSGRHTLTSMGVALGTPTYMAPEQATADPHTDHRADIYALGVMAYEMLSGRPPFGATTAQGMLAAHVTEAPEPVTKHRATVPPALNELILRCLEKKPADRWQRAEELVPHVVGMLTPTGGTTPTGTQPVISSGTEAAIARGHPVRVASVFALASIGVLALVYFLVQVIGLPDWVFYGAIALMAAGLPIMLLTGHHERKRALARSSGRITVTPAGGIQRHFTWRKALVGGGVAFAGLGVFSAGYMAMRALGIGPAGTLLTTGALRERERLLLADFENFTADTTVGESVTELLRIGLAQSRAVSLMEPSQVSDVLGRMGRAREAAVTPDLAKEISAREGLKAYIAGEVRSVGSGYVVSARVVSAGTDDALVSEKETAESATDIIRAVDHLSDRLRERIGESLRYVRADPPLDRFTTSSLEALRLYARANEAANRGDSRRSVALLKEAVTLDSTFAMAWRRMGGTMATTLVSEMGTEGMAAFRRAYALRDRLSDRERYMVDAGYWLYVENNVERTITSYEALLEKYPDDVTALNNVALSYSRLGQFAQRDSALRRAIATGQAPAVAYSNLVGGLRYRGLLAQADTVLDLWAKRFPGSPQILQNQAELAGDRMNWTEMMRIAEGVGPQQPTLDVWALNARASVAQLHGRFAEADRLREEAIGTNAERFNVKPEERDFRVELARVSRQIWFAEDRARFGPRVEEMWKRNQRLTAGLSPMQQRHFDFLALFAQVGRPQRARQLLEELGALMGPRGMEQPAIRLTIRRREAWIAAADGRPQEAVGILRGVRDENRECGLCDLNWLADAYDRAGNADSALAYYERYLETPGIRLAADDNWLARTLHRVGELHEAKGNRPKAAGYYHRFVDLWKNADPELQPSVRDAKARLARLAGEP